MGERYAGRADGKQGSIRLKCGMRTERMRAEQVVDGVGIRAEAGGFADGFTRLFRLLKAADHMLGDFAHASEGDMRRVFLAVGGKQPIVKIPQGGRCQRVAAVQLLRKRGIGNQPASNHQRMRLRALRRQQTAILSGKKVAVKAQRECRFGKGAGEHIPMRRALIKLGAGARMDNQLMDGIARKKRKQTLEFVRAGVAYARLDGNRERGIAKNAVQKAFKCGVIRQQTGAFALRGNRSGGAAEVEVDFRIAQLRQLACRPVEERGVLGEKLRYGGNAYVMLRRDGGKVAPVPDTRTSTRPMPISFCCSFSMKPARTSSSL